MGVYFQSTLYSLVLLQLHKPWSLSNISPLSCCFAWPRHFFALKLFFCLFIITHNAICSYHDVCTPMD